MRTRYHFMIVLFVLTALMAPSLFAQGDPGVGDRDRLQLLTFTSAPPLAARVGVPYVYTAVAVGQDPAAVIRYFAGWMNPPGFSIDSVSGVVTWTPPAPGWYPITILARSNTGKVGKQHFMVTVTSGNGIVQGKVTDTTGVGIPGVVIEVLHAGDFTSLPFGRYSFATRTDVNGNYRISNIEPGTYKLHAISPTPTYASQWYDGKATPFEANRITIADSPAVTIANFILRGWPAPRPLINVAGIVQDTVMVPLKGAQVFFVRSGFALNTNSTVEDFRRMFDMAMHELDFRMDGRSPHVFRAITDSLGKYSVKLVPGTYIAFARARGYAVAFYLDQSDILSAIQLLLTRDTTGIDFTLREHPPVALGTIKGSVLDSTNDVGVRSRIIAFRDRWAGSGFHPRPHSYTVDTDSLGDYALDGLLPGSYLVLALPMGSYAPAFYASDTVTTSWRRATRVDVNGNTVTGIDIYVRELPQLARGFTGIRGMVRAMSGTASAAGALVYAHWNHQIAGFGIADGSGRYEIAGLAPGTYTVTTDLPGYGEDDSKTATVSYSTTGVPQFATVDLNLSGVTDVAEAVVPGNFELCQNYPNPFNPTTFIRYTVAGNGDRGPGVSKASLVVYDLLGREVAVLMNGQQEPGTYQMAFDATNLASGVYIYRLTVGSFVQSRTMVLLK